MKSFINQISISIILLSIPSFVFSQQFINDTSFCPIYDFPGMYNSFVINSIIEDESKAIFIAGDFGHAFERLQPRNMVKLLPNGSMDSSFFHEPTNANVMQYIHNNFYYSNYGFIVKLNEIGEVDSDHWNMQNSSWSGTPTDLHVKNDSSILFSGLIISHFPSYPERDFGRLLPNGFIDTTFDHNANDVIWEIEKYDELRLLLSGRFTQYDSFQINKLCRIFNDGSIDTTFHSILTTGPINGGQSKPLYVQSDGKILLGGYFKIPNQSEFMNLIRLNPDGSLDSTFNNFNNVEIISGSNYSLTRVTSVCLTEDNNYLIGGSFNEYQGYTRGNIVLTDYNGNIIPDAFTGTGFECIINGDFYFPVTNIIRSIDNDYYIGGAFDKFNGDSVPPIIRLKKSTVGFEIINTKKELTIYPNPVTNTLNINSDFNIIDFEIYNISGDLIIQANFRSSIDVSSLSTGHYFIRARNKDDLFINKFEIVR